MALLNLAGGRRIPLLRQAEAAECGLACIGMVAAAHGFRSDLPSLRRQFAISLKGATLKDIIAIGSEIGLGARAVRCEPDELRQLRTTLSGGQQQRVMLARALYRQPRILVLDEGTSALDIGTERRVNAALKGMGITRIIAAHRPETLASADRVVGLEAGRLVPVKFELRAVPAGEEAGLVKPAKDHYTDGIGLRRDQFET